MKIFYSWQSDLDADYNKKFIRECLNLAIEKFHANYEMAFEDAPRLDMDTQDIAGTPDIASTIFEKIKTADVFIGDISFIAECQFKKIPNPNVLIELGYAFGCLGSEKIINVMNTAYGEPDKLPFDLIHKRWPITYKYDSNTKGKLTRKKKVFTERIYQALLLILTEKLTSASEDLNPLTQDNSTKNILLHILNSSLSDWHTSTIDQILYSVYQVDSNLRMEINLGERIIDDFKESWTESFPKKGASTHWCQIIFGTTIIKRLIIVNVNEGTLVPLPTQGSNSEYKISNLDFKIGLIFDQSDSLNKDIKRAGIEVALPVFSDSGLITI